MPKPIAFESRHTLAANVQVHAVPSCGVLTLLPYNRFIKDSDIWWLVPSHQSPAFSDTKFYFGRDFDEQGMIDVGIHAEKGFGEVVRQGFPHAQSAGWIMDQQWHWHTFVGLVGSGRLLKAMQIAGSALSEPLFLRLHSYYVQSRPENDAGAWVTASDQAVYRLDTGANYLVLDREPLRPNNIPVGYPDEIDSDGLTTILGKFNRQPWVWVDLFVTVPFRPERTGQGGELLWSAQQVWAEYLHLLAFAVGSMHP